MIVILLLPIKRFIKKNAWVVLKVLVYLIITVRCINAAELSGNREMVVVNTVQPLSDLKLLLDTHLKAPLFKTKGSFLRASILLINSICEHMISNIGQTVSESHGTQNWKKNDLVKINARIPFYRFVHVSSLLNHLSWKKLLQSLNEIECLKSAELNFEYTIKKNFRNDFWTIQSRNRNPNATRIDWHGYWIKVEFRWNTRTFH